MINDGLLKIILKSQAEIWLRENPLCLNSQEKQKFLLDLNEYIERSNGVLADEVFDFLVQRNLIENEPREETFINYLLKKYKNLKDVNVLDVGAGRICSLSKLIVEQGGKATAMDTNIRLSDGTIKKLNIVANKKHFKCDDFARSGEGTNIQNFDLIVGLEPCGATEHIIRQALKYDKPFDISLCAAPHKALSGDTFNSYLEWYNHLKNISKEVSIIKNDCGYIATNHEEYEL